MNTLTFKADCEIKAVGKQPTVEIVGYTGGVMSLPGYGPTIVSLQGMKLADIPLLVDHENSIDSIAGAGTPRVEGGRLIITGTLADSDAGRKVLALHRSGVKLQASIGAEVDKISYIKEGQQITANGRTFTAPDGGLTYTIGSKLREVSFVPAGADSQTSVSIAAKLRGKTMKVNPSFDSWCDDMGVDRSLMTGTELANLHANYHGRTAANESDHLIVAPYIAASAAGDPVEGEQRRLQQIENATRGDWGEEFEPVHQLKIRAVAGELSVDDLISELRPLRCKLAEGKIPMAKCNVSSGRHHAESKIIEAAFAISCGVSHPEKHFDEPVLEAADQFRGFGLQQLLLHAAAQNGYQCRPGANINAGNIRQVLMHALPNTPIRAAGFSTINIPDVVSNVANKSLLEGWNSVDQTCLRISAIRPVTNFKATTVVSLLGDVTFEELGAAGEIKHGTLSDLTYTNQASTYARMLTITRQDIINDDLGVLNAAPRKIGRGAMLKLNNVFWTKFLNNSSFFTSGNLNVSTGGGSALGDAGLATAEQKFLNQTDPDGNPLGIMPAILLVPPTLKTTGRKLINSGLLIAGTASDTQPSGNIWQGAYTLESSPYMEISTFTGYSSAAWYLLASPSQMAVIEIAALNGRVEPVVETAEADFNVLGISMRGFADTGVALQEYRGGVRSAGS
jgi:Mu-like prophage major head subunit gpT